MPHQVINYETKAGLSEEQYKEKIDDLFSDPRWSESAFHLSKALLQYLKSLPQIPWHNEIPEESLKDICRFGTLCLEVGSCFGAHSAVGIFV